MFNMKKPVMFYLTEEQKEQLVMVARHQGRTLSEIMRRSIDALIDHERGKRKTTPLQEKQAEAD